LGARLASRLGTYSRRLVLFSLPISTQEILEIDSLEIIFRERAVDGFGSQRIKIIDVDGMVVQEGDGLVSQRLDQIQFADFVQVDFVNPAISIEMRVCHVRHSQELERRFQFDLGIARVQPIVAFGSSQERQIKTLTQVEGRLIHPDNASGLAVGHLHSSGIAVGDNNVRLVGAIEERSVLPAVIGNQINLFESLRGNVQVSRHHFRVARVAVEQIVPRRIVDLSEVIATR
jgi:hypothetical protein